MLYTVAMYIIYYVNSNIAVIALGKCKHCGVSLSMCAACAAMVPNDQVMTGINDAWVELSGMEERRVASFKMHP